MRKVFEEKEKFVLIGLTGRTGSGCTTIAKFLDNKFSELNLPISKDHSFNNNSERKYNVVYSYMSKNWNRF